MHGLKINAEKSRINAENNPSSYDGKYLINYHMEVIMGWKPIDTKLVKEILQLRANGLSFDQIA